MLSIAYSLAAIVCVVVLVTMIIEYRGRKK